MTILVLLLARYSAYIVLLLLSAVLVIPKHKFTRMEYFYTHIHNWMAERNDWNPIVYLLTCERSAAKSAWNSFISLLRSILVFTICMLIFFVCCFFNFKHIQNKMVTNFERERIIELGESIPSDEQLSDSFQRINDVMTSDYYNQLGFFVSFFGWHMELPTPLSIADQYQLSPFIRDLIHKFEDYINQTSYSISG